MDNKGQLSLVESKATRQFADISAISFIKIVCNLRLSDKLSKYSKN